MTDRPIDLDLRRSTDAQDATRLRRLMTEVNADQTALRQRQDEIESHLLASPSQTWPEAAIKARYVLGLLAESILVLDVRKQNLISQVIADFDRLAAAEPEPRGP